MTPFAESEANLGIIATNPCDHEHFDCCGIATAATINKLNNNTWFRDSSEGNGVEGVRSRV